MKWITLLLLTASLFSQTSRPSNIVTTDPGKTNTFAGPVSAVTVTSCTVNNILYIGGTCASNWGGGDIGAQANSAYASCPASPSFCEIHVLGQGATYNFNTPITFSTPGQTVMFDLGGNTINYTPTSATTAITLSYGAPPSSNGGLQPHGIRNGLIQNNGCPAGNGCGGYISASSATGVLLGSSVNSATGPQISNVVISGFSNGIYLPPINNVMWGLVLFNDMISSNNIGILCDIGGAYESLQILSTRITINQVGLAQKCNFDIYMHGASMDGNTIAIQQTGSHTFVDGTHFEATNASSGLVAQVTGGAVVFSNSFFLDDNSSGTIASWFTCATSGQLDFSQVDISSAGRTTTGSVINVGTGCNLVGVGGITNDTPGVLTSLVQGAATNQIYAVNANGTNRLYLQNISTVVECNVNSASPAACTSAASGSVVVPTTTVTYTVNTTAVTATSRIFIQPITDNSGLSGAPTCNVPPTPFIGYQSARVAGTSFTFTLPSTTGTSCWQYFIVN